MGGTQITRYRAGGGSYLIPLNDENGGDIGHDEMIPFAVPFFSSFDGIR